MRQPGRSSRKAAIAALSNHRPRRMMLFLGRGQQQAGLLAVDADRRLVRVDAEHRADRRCGEVCGA
jgi:hypothetical protein